MNLGEIKKYNYQNFLNILYFYYSLYDKINSIPNKKFIDKNRKKQLNDFDYIIHFLNFNLNNEKSKNIFFEKKNNYENNQQYIRDKNQNCDEIIYIKSSTESEKSEKEKEINNNNLFEDFHLEKNENFPNIDSSIILKKKRKLKRKDIYYYKNKTNDCNNTEKYDDSFAYVINNKINNSNSFSKKKDISDNKINELKILKKSFRTDIEIKSENLNRNGIFQNKIKDEKFRHSKAPKIHLRRLSKDEDFKNLIKDLNDYLKRIIGEHRMNSFFKRILPESRNIVKKLFSKQNHIHSDTKIPIYRNDYLELSLIIKKGGKISKQILYSEI